ncbi:MAG: radical SAM protein [Pseudomonadota bacterium]
MLLEQAAVHFRSKALQNVDPEAQGLPKSPHTVFLWPTQLCSIGCAHCSFGARKSGDEALRRLAHQPDKVVQWLTEAGAARMVICGGGEPLDEPDFIPLAIEQAVKNGIRTEIYTAGISLARPVDVRATITNWRDALNGASFHLRLSVDHFHSERVGHSHIAQWVRQTAELVPHWKVSLRGIRVDGDKSIEQIAETLSAEIQQRRPHIGKLVLENGRTIAFERKAFVLDNRGTLALLRRRGLSLPPEEMAQIEDDIDPDNPTKPMGRPFSAPLTVGRRRMDLEIHANGVVNILESQAPDLRRNLFEASWAKIRDAYFRDPIMHLVAKDGLPAVADLIMEGQNRVDVDGTVVPYSIQHLSDPALRGWVTAQAMRACRDTFTYTKTILAEADALDRGMGT